jgi:hypothetical protein
VGWSLTENVVIKTTVRIKIQYSYLIVKTGFWTGCWRIKLSDNLFMMFFAGQVGLGPTLSAIKRLAT